MPSDWSIYINSKDTLWILIGLRIIITLFRQFPKCHVNSVFSDNSRSSPKDDKPQLGVYQQDAGTRACSD